MTLDQMILLFIQDSIRCDWLTDIIRAITLMGDNGLIWLVLLLLLLIYPKTRKLGLVAGLSFLVAHENANGVGRRLADAHHHLPRFLVEEGGDNHA